MKRFLILFFLGLLSAIAAHAAPKQIALTFDDLPGWGYTDCSAVQGLSSLARTLQDKHIPATGFVIGSKTVDAPEHLAAVEAWARSGLPLANHTWTHRKYAELTIDAFIDELKKTEAVIRRGCALT